MEFPDSLKPFEKQAFEALKSECVADLEFSGNTYQVRIKDPQTGELFWTFLQLEAQDKIKDSFCECDTSEEAASFCLHQAIAYLALFQGKKGELLDAPLHERFERSFWNALFRLYAKEGKELIPAGKKGYLLDAKNSPKWRLIKAKTREGKAKLVQLIEDWKVETEETSLKFSDLPEEELALWRSGLPTPQLTYALSHWFDLAKWLFSLQEKEGMETRFSNVEGLPLKIDIELKEVAVSCLLSKEELSKLVPALPSLNPPFFVHDLFRQRIEKAVFHPEEKSVSIIWKKSSEKMYAEKQGVPLPGWIFVPKEGFYPEDKGWLSQTILRGSAIGELLDRFPSIGDVFVGAKIHSETQRLIYSLHFDKKWNLHISPFLFEVGDLLQRDAAFFGKWVYLPKEGFYHLDEVKKFGENKAVSTIISQENVPAFIQDERKFLMDQEGFTIHIFPLEVSLGFSLDDQERLHFFQKSLREDSDMRIKDFGPWIYVAEEGFYPKGRQVLGGAIRPGMVFSKEQIPLFIKEHKDELKLISGFFLNHCPIEKAKLKIELKEDENVLISPIYYLEEGIYLENLSWFDDVVYVWEEGFYQIPPTRRLPSGFREEKKIAKEDLAYFILHLLPELNPFIEWIDPRLKKPETLQLIVTDIKKAEIDGNFDLKMSYRTEQGRVDVSALLSALHQKRRFYFDLAGMFDLFAPRFSWLRAAICDARKGEAPLGAVRLSSLELFRLSALEEVSFEGKEGDAFLLWEQLSQLTPPLAPNLNALKSKLRSYQETGVNWLWFLWNYRLSGLLCDDMGLGKTHQAMALIAACLPEIREKNTPVLVVCPTSVLFHWQEKLEEYLPDAKVLTFYGTGRKFDLIRHRYDILLTSYGVLRLESALFSQLYFSLAIFDEIQAAKNHQSRLYASLLNIRRGMCLGLTGTPIENRLRELKALFDLVLPSYMPNERQFRDMFIKTIEREGSLVHKQLLSRLIRPFVLRRKKKDVLLDLPEKIEEVAHCSLDPEQRRLYEEILTHEKPALLDQLGKGESLPFIHIFAILSKLKQICNHPASYLKTPKLYKEHNSGKWELFVELLQEALASQQKVVVFSHYLAMLDIIQLYLKEQGIAYAQLRGATQNRGDEVKKFQKDPNCQVFLGSLHAAGWGVDLTAGSVVIHYDRWWNAARENQATDRVHRLGQTRGVQVFKLVTKGTIEDRIDELIASKGALMEDVVGLDDHSLIKRLTKEELFDLLTLQP